MKKTYNRYVITVILVGIAFHGSALFFTLESSYDALTHLFFAEHYVDNWFEPWNTKWYTGFTVMSYPPLVHQSIALLSIIGGLKFGLFTVAFLSIILFITGVYKYSLLITSDRTIASYAAFLAVFSSSFVETLHIFGQIPSIIGIAVLLHALPEIYLWLKTGRYRYLCSSLSLIAVTATSHHVTPIFGMVFFIFPIIGMAVLDLSKDQVGSFKEVNFTLFIKNFKKQFKRIASFSTLSILLIIGCILPYWLNSKNNPITQIPIPHGSRDNFLEITSSGLIFFLIPWGVLLFLWPYFFYRFFSKRYLFFGLSFSLLVILGTGATTPIPKILLGENAFNILTLDRFTFWASIMSLPLFGEFTHRFMVGDLKKFTQRRFGKLYYRLLGCFFVGLFLFMTIFTMSLGYFRPSQPKKIKMLPILNFLNQDQHDQWRYLTLGFGDQMAWLSAQTKAMTVDGNYHSARRLPELTTRPVERLENSKFTGIAGIGSLQQFLTTPEKYNLKYIFSNDKFYDPILYFCGWQRLPQLENGILIWEKLNVPPLTSFLTKEEVATWQKILWGMVPLLALILAFIFNLPSLFVTIFNTKFRPKANYRQYHNHSLSFSKGLLKTMHIWTGLLLITIMYSLYDLYLKNNSQRTPENVITSYYDALDLKELEKSFYYIDPFSNVSISQYMLEIAVTDGLLNSYAKLDALEILILKKTDSLVTLKIATNWITPLEKVSKVNYKTVVKRGKKWYIVPNQLDSDSPPDQLYSNNITKYFNQGRKKISTEQTYHEDVLKQPVLEIISAKLVKFKNHFALIGEIQNIDNVPADIVLKGTLYNDESKELAIYNAKYHVKHKLMPKEISSFRINFEGIAWTKTADAIPETFNPDEFTPIAFEEQPTNFNLQVAGNVSNSDLYKDLALSDLKINSTTIKGTLFNSGLQEITVPQLLISYYDKNKNIVWVDHLFLKRGIKQQRKKYFEYALLKNDSIAIINNDMSNCFVNGLPNKNISSKIVPNRIKKHSTIALQKIIHPNYAYVKIEMNSYIGNPN